jgi:hypothetical protein
MWWGGVGAAVRKRLQNGDFLEGMDGQNLQESVERDIESGHLRASRSGAVGTDANPHWMLCQAIGQEKS